MSHPRWSVEAWAQDTAGHVYLLFAKVKNLVASLRTASADEYDEFFDSFANLSLGELTPPEAERCCMGHSAPPVSHNGRMLLPLPDSLVTDVRWRHIPRSISLMCRLRRVNRAWRDYIVTTVEWIALEFTKLDSRGYERFAWRWRGFHRRRTRFERYNIEIGNLNVVLSEPQFPKGNLVWCTGT
jgi:hypothetical protein